MDSPPRNQHPFFRGFRLVGSFHFAYLILLAARSGLAEQPGSAHSAVITNAADIISLPAAEAATSRNIRVTGIVTAADPGLNGRFFIQDHTGGVFVDNANGHRPEPGTVVEVTGITHPGAYAPIITAPTVRLLGSAPLPPARAVPIERLMSGAEDSQRIEISGVVRDARVDKMRLTADFVSGGYRYRVYAPSAAAANPQSLIAAEVRVRGTAAEAHNRSLRQLVAVEIYVPRPEDFIIEMPESTNPWQETTVPLDSLAQYRRDNSLNRRVHVRGVVSFQRRGESLFIHDATGGLQIQSSQLTPFTPGQVVEAVGFPSFDQYLPVMQDASFQASGETRVSILPKSATVAELQDGLHHADYVSVIGRLLNRTVTQEIRRGDVAGGGRTTLVLQSSNQVFTAQAENSPDQNALADIPLGSIIQVSGICLSEIDSDGRVKSFRLLTGDAGQVLVLKRPGWLTTPRLLVILGIVCCLSVVGVAWTVILSRKNGTLSLLIRDREQAQRELQMAHDQLEERVRQRTEELKFQITARKEVELQSKAVLAERTRLAQELHDTVEQTLTGIALQLDTAAKLDVQKPAQARDHLALARNMMSKSQVELRRSVWDLRQRALEKFSWNSHQSGLADKGCHTITSGGGRGKPASHRAGSPHECD
jgi:signal transduction histidine kinase